MNELIFEGGKIELITRDGELWARATQIGLALGYAHPDTAITKLYNRNKDEFSESMTGVVKMTTPSGDQETRIFSLRGAHLLAMFSRTKTAKAFRRWVLDILDALHRGGEYAMQQYRQARDALTQGKEVASECGKGLNHWKRIKQPLTARLAYWSERRQLPLLFNG